VVPAESAEAQVVEVVGMKTFALVAAGVFAGMLLAFAFKAAMQWYGCKAYGLFSDTYCALQVLMR
jgi:hypothetical protein